MTNFNRVVTAQKAYFNAGKTRDIDTRLQSLAALKNAIETHRGEILRALYTDLHKGELEAQVSEIGLVTGELAWFLKQLPRLARPKKVSTPLYLWPSKSHILKEPLGTCLVISPWNYPFQLSMIPLVAAVAAGNTVVLKPSERSRATSEIVTRIVDTVFPAEHVVSLIADPDEANALLSLPFDKIFFTGSRRVGRIVYEAAAKQMIPVTLELGGKNPCIVLEDAHIETASKRIVWGKFFNAGQTCIAPDFVVAHERIKDELVRRMRQHITAFFGASPRETADYGRLIDGAHTRRVATLSGAPSERLATGGEDTYMPPTLLTDVDWNSTVMTDEIFGPILPILSFQDVAPLVQRLNDGPTPLAAYIFSSNADTARHLFDRLRCGGGCINDTLLQISTPHLPFGGLGESGIGAYHGDHGFGVFTHLKSRVTTPRFPSLEIRFPPYTARALKLLRRLMK